jgi:hypothetical protein
MLAERADRATQPGYLGVRFGKTPGAGGEGGVGHASSSSNWFTQQSQ